MTHARYLDLDGLPRSRPALPEGFDDWLDVAVLVLPTDDGSTAWWYCRVATATLLRYGLLSVEFHDREAVA